MIECIFTIDYELYGNGEGSLKELVYEPAERLATIFRRRNARFMPFVEVAELEMIEAKGTDTAIDPVKNQIREFHRDGFELGLHLHPQWYNARYDQGRWLLDKGEYNLCTLQRERIVEIVDRSISYLRDVLGSADFTPLSFRAGNWLFKPTQPVADVLAERGIKVDSSVFKGGLRHQHRLDYRRALRNGDWWAFSDQVDVPDPMGALLEIPIHTQMVPFWKMIKPKRVNPQHIGFGAGQSGRDRLYRLFDFLRYWHPLKLDFCCMTIDELTHMVDAVIRKDRLNPSIFRPIVAIGHTKELVDFETVESFLDYLTANGISVSTFADICEKCKH
jgi:hypothetical protein